MTKVLTIRLDEELYEKTEIIAKNLKRSKNWIIKEVLEKYLEDMFDIEEAKKIMLDKKDKIISHEKARKQILSD